MIDVWNLLSEAMLLVLPLQWKLQLHYRYCHLSCGSLINCLHTTMHHFRLDFLTQMKLEKATRRAQEQFQMVLEEQSR